MPSGGWRGGGRPRAWRLRSGEPAKLTRLEVIKEAMVASKLIAHAIDDGVVTEAQVIEWVNAQRLLVFDKQKTGKNHD